MQKQPVSVLVVEDDPLVRKSLVRSLRVEGYLVETAENGEIALNRVSEIGPDIVVMDVTMPVMDGFQTCRLLRARGDTVPVIMLTARGIVSDRIYGLDIGAQDYLAKPFVMEELFARIRACLRDRPAASPARRTHGDIIMDTATRQAWRGRRELVLTKTEFQLLLLFVTDPLVVHTRAHLQSAIWGYSPETPSSTLDVFISGLRRKLEEDGERRTLATVHSVGYALRD